MSNYTKTTDFASKDALLTGNPSKVVKGTEINTEFSNIQTAVNSKLDSSGVTAFAATLLDDVNAATARGTLEAAKSGANADITSWSGGQLAGLRNAIINGNFGINQRAVSGTVVLTAGQYGHDRFKAGASGCTYTFSTTANVTTLTISAGSLQQVIEGANLQSGTYALSWTGTAQGKIGAGSYSASGITGSAVGGTNLTIEFNTGTLSKVQLEYGSVATAFEFRPYGTELMLCQRYCVVSTQSITAVCPYTSPSTLSDMLADIFFPVTMRSAPTVTLGTQSTPGAGIAVNISPTGFRYGGIAGAANTAYTVAGFTAVSEP